ncbi:hypothetical protein ACGC1H_002483 [Rhizoctonia solani]|uniref:Uncharacterized protein n=1 Tax=Rhizoctonia solani TaxID=456999 RepID=A0A8H3GFK3_9AGAM|nr:unnamed protein product [Rhizoctonia solani]
MVAASSLRGQPAWSPRPGGAFNARKRYALQLMNQAKSIAQKHEPKRKRVITLDTEEGPPPPHHTPKRTCHTDQDSKFDSENPLGLDLWEESDLERGEPFVDSSHEEDMTVEYARSAEKPMKEMDLSDLSDISPTSPDDDLFDESESSTSSCDDSYGLDDYQLYDKSAIKRFAEELPSLLKRRHRTSVLSQRKHWIDDEPLRVKFLNRRFKRRLQTGDFTVSQILEVLEQRPVYGTYGDLNIPTPQVVPVQEDAEDPEDLDLADTKFDDLMAVTRPSTPMPDSDSDSESDGEPVYASSQISEQLSRREMESMGIYEDEEYEYESEDE